jgi:hypothetical protein
MGCLCQERWVTWVACLPICPSPPISDPGDDLVYFGEVNKRSLESNHPAFGDCQEIPTPGETFCASSCPSCGGSGIFDRDHSAHQAHREVGLDQGPEGGCSWLLGGGDDVDSRFPSPL